MKLCLVSFSGRSGGNCGRILETLRQDWAEKARLAVYDFSTFALAPCGDCDYECFQARKLCPHFADPAFSLCDAVTNSDRACFVVPNYCDYPCAHFFAFNERGQCYFQQHPALLDQYLAVPKRFIVVSNTGRENFTAAFRYHVAEGTEPEVLFLSAREFGRTSIAGDLMEAPEAKRAVLDFAGGAPRAEGGCISEKSGVY